MNLEFTDRWLSVQEIAHYLGISKETVYRWLDSKKIPAHKIGRQWRFKVIEVDDWIKSGGAIENDIL
jgi:excisionase family DNA binding protein